MHKKIILTTLFVLSFIRIYGQEKHYIIPDSLKQKTCRQLEQAYFKSNRDSVKIIYAKACLQLAKQQNDAFYKASGYHFLSYHYTDEKSIAYLDSAIAVSSAKPNIKYPSYVYMVKGNQYFNKSQFKQALDNYVQAKKYAIQTNNIYFENDIQLNIALLNDRIGKDKKALALFKKCHQFNIKFNYKKNNNYRYLLTLFGLGDSYRRNKQLDSSSFYNRLGHQEAVLSQNTFMTKLFSINEGATLCAKKNYQTAIDSILPALKDFNNAANIAISHFYLGKAYLKIQKPNLGIQHLKLMDSIVKQINNIMPEEREGYTLLIDHYKQHNKLKQQLYYTERLIQVDSLLQRFYKDLNLPIYKNFTAPNLLKQKETLIRNLEQQGKQKNIVLFGSSLAIFVLFLLLFSYKRREKQLQKRFEQIQEQLKTRKNISKPFVQNENKTEKQELKEAVVKELLEKLTQFEEEEYYLTRKLTQTALAKQLHTNSSYLSKVINQYKGMSFSQYLNELRINYILVRLKTDKRLRNYTIKAIANECGYTSSDSFATAFYAKTGLKPSYYIKKINSENIDN